MIGSNTRGSSNIGNILLLTIFLILLVLSIFILLDAFINLKYTNYYISQLLFEISSLIEKKNLVVEGELNPQAKAYLEQLKFQSKGTLDSNTISFLFQVFAIALVSAGIYLYTRSSENLKSVEIFLESIKKQAEDAKANITLLEKNLSSINEDVKFAEESAHKTVKRLQLLEPIFRNNITSSTIVTFFSQAYIISLLVAKEESDIALLVNFREILHQIRNQLSLARKLNLGFDKFTHSSLLDQAINISQNLNKAKNEKNFIDFQNLISDITEILKTTQFVERYENQLGLLAEDFNS